MKQNIYRILVIKNLGRVISLATELQYMRSYIFLRMCLFLRKLASFPFQIFNCYRSAKLDAQSEPQKTEPHEKPVRFAVQSLGWVKIAEEDLTPERSSRAVNKCIVDLSFGRNDINDVVGRWGDVSVTDVSSRGKDTQQQYCNNLNSIELNISSICIKHYFWLVFFQDR